MLRLVPPEEIPLGEKCPENDPSEIYKKCLLMEELCDKENGIGLSAVQVGIPWNLFIIKFGLITLTKNPYYRYFLNCSYDPIDDEKDKSLEGCLSLRDKYGNLRRFEVERYKHIRVVGKELVIEDGNLKIVDFIHNPDEDDYYRVVFQHEADHAWQILISNIGKEYEIWSN